MTKTSYYYQTHIFCCTNERAPDNARGCCKAKGSEAIREYLKTRIKELTLPKARVNNAGCLDRCELGPVIVIYPEGVWYHCPDVAAAEEIIQSHLLQGKPVPHLQLRPDQKRLDVSQTQ